MFRQSPVQRRNDCLFYMGVQVGALHDDFLPQTFFVIACGMAVSSTVVHVVHLQAELSRPPRHPAPGRCAAGLHVEGRLEQW